MNKAQLFQKLLKQRERDHQRAEFAERKLEVEAQKPPYNTGQYNTTVVCKVYKAGRTYLVRIPKSVVQDLNLKPMDLVTVFIKKEVVENHE
jgi:hypothetical protein